MRILHIQKATGIAGSERHLLTLLPGLALRGHDVRAVVLVAGKGQDLAAELRAAGVETEAIEAGPHFHPVIVARLLGAARRFRADVVHTHLIHADLYGQLAAWLGHVPGVSSIHGVAGPYCREPWRSAAALGGHLAHATIAISDYAATVVEERRLAPRNRVTVVHYGIDLDHWHVPDGDEVSHQRVRLGVGPADVAVVVASRLVEHKGHDFVLDGFERAAAVCPDIRLVIAGEGPLRPALEAKAAKLNSGDRISFAGFVTDVRGLLAAADVVVFPTMPAIGEGFGLVVLEAMATGRPVVATTVASLTEIAVHGETAILVAPGDVSAMADALVRLAGDAALRERLGAQGRRRGVELFGADQMVERTIGVYEEVLGRKHRGARPSLVSVLSRPRHL